MANFKCYKCNRVLPDFERTGCLIGYAIDDIGKYCYDCLTQMEVETMIFQRDIILYLVNESYNEIVAPETISLRFPDKFRKEGVPFSAYSKSCQTFKHSVQNFFGTLKLPVDKISSCPHNLCGFQIHVRFCGPDGSVWSGRNVGDNQILYCHKLKRQRKKLTPLTNYITKYNYK